MLVERARSEELGLFASKALIVTAIGLALVIVWLTAPVLFLLFAGVLMAILLHRLAQAVQSWTRLPRGFALALVLLGLAGGLAAGFAFLGATIAGQFDQFASQLESAIASLPSEVKRQLQTLSERTSLMSGLTSAASAVIYALGNIVLVVFIGIYLAIDPRLYLSGITGLFGQSRRARVSSALAEIGEVLWLWLVGQFVSMAVIGTLTTAFLLALGVPAAVPLGIVAFLFEFVPLVGAILGIIPAVLITFPQGNMLTLWVVLGYMVIQQVEGQIVTPLVQRRVVQMPPVVTVMAVATGGTLFGILGVFLSSPIAVVILKLISWSGQEKPQENA